jgi:hypothetical protein
LPPFLSTHPHALQVLVAFLLLGLAAQQALGCPDSTLYRPSKPALYEELPEAALAGTPRKLAAAKAVKSTNELLGLKSHIALFSGESCKPIAASDTCDQSGDDMPQEVYACCSAGKCLAPLGVKFACKPGIQWACCRTKEVVQVGTA